MKPVSNTASLRKTKSFIENISLYRATEQLQQKSSGGDDPEFLSIAMKVTPLPKSHYTQRGSEQQNNILD